jgi:hypothetical protein
MARRALGIVASIGCFALAACGGGAGAGHAPGGSNGGVAGATGAAGSATSPSGGTTGAAGGGGDPTPPAGTGGATGMGGALGTGGATSSGGAPGAAGVTGAGGAPATAGTTGTAGATGAGGFPGTAGAPGGLTGAAWDAKYPRDKRKMILHDEGTNTVHYLDLADPTTHWSAPTTTWSRGLQLVGNGQVMGSRNDGYEEYDLATGKITKQVKTFPNTVSVYRLANGDTMIAQGATLNFVAAKTDAPKSKIQYQGYGYVRMVRPTPQGTWLVPSDMTLFEGDDKGTILWHTTGTGWFHMWEAQRLPNGNLLVGTGYGASLDIVDGTTHKVLQRLGTNALPEAATVHPNFFADIQILPNGNYVTANWEGHGGGNGTTGRQVLELDPSGKLVWAYQQDPKLFSSIQGVLIIDGLDPQQLHVLSAAGPWAPVAP